MEEMYFAWLENPQSVHKVGTPTLLYGREAPGAGLWGKSGNKELASCVTLGRFLCLSGPPSFLCVKEPCPHVGWGKSVAFLLLNQPVGGGLA